MASKQWRVNSGMWVQTEALRDYTAQAKRLAAQCQHANQMAQEMLEELNVAYLDGFGDGYRSKAAARDSQPKEKPPLPVAPDREALRAVVRGMPGTIFGIRNRAILLLGVAAKLHRRELVELKHKDVSFTSRGMSIRCSQRLRMVEMASDQELCPVRAVVAWIQASNEVKGPLFRTLNAGGAVYKAPIGLREVGQILSRLSAAEKKT